MNGVRLPVCLMLLSLGWGGCVGTVADSHGGDPAAPAGGKDPRPVTGPVPGGDGIPASVGCRETAPAVTAVRRLTRDEYTNTLRDLLGDAQKPVAVPFA